MSSPLRALLLTVLLLAPGAGWSQDDGCSQRCSGSMGTCMGNCGSNEKCATTCGKKLTECLGRCTALKAPLGKKCVGANGKPIPCPNYKPPAPAKEVPPEPDEQ